MIVAALSENSYKQYDTALRRWWFFCNKRDLNPFVTNIPEVAGFLAEEFNRGLGSGSLNSFRSAIALIQGPHVGEDPRIKRMFKGIYNLKPSLPKYDLVWDPQIILDHFSEKQDNEFLSLKDLSKKLITLLAIITSHRVQTYSLIKRENIEVKPQKIVIKIPDRIKTSGPNKSQPVLFLPFYEANCKVCAASTLVFYLKKTQNLCRNASNLFISFKNPFKEVGSQTLSRWISETLKEAGVNTDIFTAHSTRHASSSTAKNKGISIDLIRKTAGWSEASLTFARFYDRQVISRVDQCSFADAIYNS